MPVMNGFLAFNSVLVDPRKTWVVGLATFLFTKPFAVLASDKRATAEEKFIVEVVVSV